MICTILKKKQKKKHVVHGTFWHHKPIEKYATQRGVIITKACFNFIYILSMTKPLEESKLSHLALRRNTKHRHNTEPSDHNIAQSQNKNQTTASIVWFDFSVMKLDPGPLFEF